MRHALWLMRYSVFIPVHAVLWWLDVILFHHALKKIEISPVFIIGQPRSGSTFLHRTLAHDAGNFFAIRHFEWRYPYITMQWAIKVLRLHRLVESINYWPKNGVGMKASQMHQNNLYDWEEDGIFFEERLLYHYFVFLRFPYPGLLSAVDDFNKSTESKRRKVLDLHEAAIKKVQLLRGKGKLYLSKEVESVSKLHYLRQKYANAKFIVVARESKYSVNSFIALVSASTAAKSNMNVPATEWWINKNIDKKRSDCQEQMAFASSVDGRHKIELAYNVFSTEISKTVTLIYKKLGINAPTFHQQYIEEVEKRQKMREGPVEYNPSHIEGFEKFDNYVSLIESEHKSLIGMISNKAHRVASNAVLARDYGSSDPELFALEP